METIKKIFPLSFTLAKDITNFVIGIVGYLLAGIIFGFVTGIATKIVGWIPVIGAIIGWALGIVGTLVTVYSIAGLILLILVYCKVIKD